MNSIFQQSISETEEHIDPELTTAQQSDSGIQTEELKEPERKRRKTDNHDKDYHVQNPAAVAASRDKQDPDTDPSSDTSNNSESSASSFS